MMRLHVSDEPHPLFRYATLYNITRILLKMEESYNFDKSPPEDYFCVICAMLLSEPHLTDCRGQHFRLEQWTRLKNKQRFVLTVALRASITCVLSL